MKQRTGFTMVELAVVAGIMVMLTSVVLFNAPRFRSMSALQRDANKMTLALRKAQTYALAVREFNSTYTDDPFCSAPPVRFPPYGVSFSLTPGGAGDARNDTAYIIFGDANCSQRYTVSLPDGSNEQVDVFNTANSVKLQSITGFDSTGCAAGCALLQAHAVYQRPAPTIILSGGAYTNLERLEIVLQSSGNASLTKKIIINVAGQVAVE